MQLQIDKDLKLKDYTVILSFTDITPLDQEKLNDFGVITMEIGGNIPYGVDQTFTLSNDTKAIPTDFPITRTFKTAVYGENAKVFAEAYIEEMKKRAKAKIDELTLKVDDFSGQELFQL